MVEFIVNRKDGSGFQTRESMLLRELAEARRRQEQEKLTPGN